MVYLGLPISWEAPPFLLTEKMVIFNRLWHVGISESFISSTQIELSIATALVLANLTSLIDTVQYTVDPLLTPRLNTSFASEIQSRRFLRGWMLSSNTFWLFPIIVDIKFDMLDLESPHFPAADDFLRFNGIGWLREMRGTSSEGVHFGQQWHFFLIECNHSCFSVSESA